MSSGKDFVDFLKDGEEDCEEGFDKVLVDLLWHLPRILPSSWCGVAWHVQLVDKLGDKLGQRKELIAPGTILVIIIINYKLKNSILVYDNNLK